MFERNDTMYRGKQHNTQDTQAASHGIMHNVLDKNRRFAYNEKEGQDDDMERRGTETSNAMVTVALDKSGS